MRKVMQAVLPAFLLTACAGSTRSALSYSPAIPPVPAEAKKPCLPTPMQRQPDGSADSSDTGDLFATACDLTLCDARRAFAIASWPTREVAKLVGQRLPRRPAHSLSRP
jgi:hypothetical protein